MFGSVLIFIIVLSVLVLVHELGHFFAARRAGVLVEEFGFGIPPRVFGKKIGETIYSINLLPFGGFVRLHGENSEDEVKEPKRAFINQDKKTRSKIILAGVFMNFVLALLCFSLTYSLTGIPRESENVKIVEVNKGSPAESSGLTSGDIIREINGKKVASNNELIEAIDLKRGSEVVLKVERNGSISDISAFPRENPPEGEGALGIQISTTETYFPPIYQRPFVGVYYGFKESLFWSGIIITGFIELFRNLFAGIVPKDVAGPVGIFALTSQAAQFGILTLINFVGILSVNLAILNVIPFPALDGGRFLFVFLESIIGKKIVPRVESIIHTIGMVILILLILAITAHDIQKLISGGGISGYIDSVLK